MEVKSEEREREAFYHEAADVLMGTWGHGQHRDHGADLTRLHLPGLFCG